MKKRQTPEETRRRELMKQMVQELGITKPNELYLLRYALYIRNAMYSHSSSDTLLGHAFFHGSSMTMALRLPSNPLSFLSSVSSLAPSAATVPGQTVSPVQLSTPYNVPC